MNMWAAKSGTPSSVSVGAAITAQRMQNLTPETEGLIHSGTHPHGAATDSPSAALADSLGSERGTAWWQISALRTLDEAADGELRQATRAAHPESRHVYAIRFRRAAVSTYGRERLEQSAAIGSIALPDSDRPFGRAPTMSSNRHSLGRRIPGCFC
jgi:hypothetical protein